MTVLGKALQNTSPKTLQKLALSALMSLGVSTGLWAKNPPVDQPVVRFSDFSTEDQALIKAARASIQSRQPNDLIHQSGHFAVVLDDVQKQTYTLKYTVLLDPIVDIALSKHELINDVKFVTALIYLDLQQYYHSYQPSDVMVLQQGLKLSYQVRYQYQDAQGNTQVGFKETDLLLSADGKYYPVTDANQ
ncbi:hypothetical protein [Acinetobacter larvae]|nr:hypothetical protein [Acinetobacter larvae]